MGEEYPGMIVGWKAIAAFCNQDVEAMKSRFYRAGLRLPKLKGRGRTATVYAFRCTLELLKSRLFRGNRKRA